MDIDLTHPDSASQMLVIKAALEKYHVLVFRQQSFTPDSLTAFMSLLGPPCIHPTSPNKITGKLEVIRLNITSTNTAVPGQQWHADLTCEKSPPQYTGLWIEKVPGCGGDTVFANMHAAYDLLSPGMKKYLCGLTVHHSGEAAWGAGAQNTVRSCEHPMIIAHPDTGRPTLYFDMSFSRNIANLAHIEDYHVQALIRQVIMASDTVKARISWQSGTFVIWDNFSVQHKAIFDYRGQPRSGLRMMCRPITPRAYHAH